LQTILIKNQGKPPPPGGGSAIKKRRIFCEAEQVPVKTSFAQNLIFWEAPEKSLAKEKIFNTQ